MPTLFDRLKAAVAPAPKTITMGNFPADASKNAYGLMEGIYPAARGEPPPRGTQERLEGYNQMPWLRTCAEITADAVAAVQWQLFAQKKAGKIVRNRAYQRGNWKTRALIKAELQDRNELVEIESHPFLDLVIDKGNSFLTGQATRKVTQLHVDLAGEAFWLYQRAQGGIMNGLPIAVWPIPPHWILGTPTPTHPFFRVGYRAWIGDIPATEFLWMANPNPVFPYGRGTGLAGALSDELETDEYASRFLKQYFYNDATPPFIVSPKGDGPTSVLTETEARRLEQSWLNKLQGYWKAHKPLFTTRGVDIKEFQRDLRSMQMVQLREHERDVVMQVFRIPPELFGLLAHSNRATVDLADYIFNTKVVTPRLDFLRANLQEKALPVYDDRLILDYISPVAEDKNQQLAAATVAPWSLTVDEWRSRAGAAALGNDAGNVHMVPFTMQPMADLAVPPPSIDKPLAESPSEVIPPDEVSPVKSVQDLRTFTADGLDRVQQQVAQLATQMANTPAPPTVVTVHPPAITVTVPERSVTVEKTEVNVAASPAPNVHVDGPTIHTPAVHVDGPTIHPTVALPAKGAKKVTKRVTRDAEDRITAITEETED